MVATRPDICYTITRLSQDLAKPHSFHLTKVKRLTLFKRHNQSVTDIKEITETLEIGRVCDLDWGNLDDRKSEWILL